MVLRSSLFWLLKEPLIYGSRLDILDACGTMTAAFIKSKTITIGCLVKVAGPRFGKAEDVAVLLGVKVHPNCYTQVLQKLQSAFIVEELKMLQGYSDGELIPNEKDQFPNLLLSLKL